MGRTDRSARRWSTTARWMLLAAVLTGLFGMHVITAEDGAGRHSVLQVANMVGHDDVSGPNVPPAETRPEAMDAAGSVSIGTVVTPAEPAGGDHGAMAACVLFLVVGGAALILILLLRLRDGQGTTAPGMFTIAVADMRRRGPPGRWPRLALCVIRV